MFQVCVIFVNFLKYNKDGSILRGNVPWKSYRGSYPLCLCPFLPSPTRAIITMSLAQLSSPRLRARDEQVPEPALKITV